jgi:hypothetical protein
LKAERLQHNLVSPIVLGPDECRAMTARALERLPYLEQLTVMAQTRFVMADGRQAEYFSAGFLSGHGLLLLGPGRLSLPAEEQVQALLPQLAHAVLKSRHALEQPHPGLPLERLVNEETGEWDTAALDEELELLGGGAQDLCAEVNLARVRADEPARKWQAEWEPRDRPPALRRR